MASLVAVRPRSHLLMTPVAVLLVATIHISSFTSLTDSAAGGDGDGYAPAPPTEVTAAAKPATAAAAKPKPTETTDAVSGKKPVEVYPGCSKTIMPKRCSVRLAILAKHLSETNAVAAGPQIAAVKQRNGTCITKCTTVLDETTAKASAARNSEDALKQLNRFIYTKVINNYGPIGPCECTCPATPPAKPCSPEESAAVKKLGDALEPMTTLGNLLGDLFDSKAEEKKAAAAEMEKAMDSGILHVSCGLTKLPQKCSDELIALASLTKEANHAAWHLQDADAGKLSPELDAVIKSCSEAIQCVNKEIESAEVELKSLAEIQATLHSYVVGNATQQPLCKYECPEEKPCTADEKAVVEQLTGVYDMWAAADRFLAGILPNTPAAAAANGKDEANGKEAATGKEAAPKKKEVYE